VTDQNIGAWHIGGTQQFAQIDDDVERAARHGHRVAAAQRAGQ
jgi:hypothetical protein